MMVLKTQVQCQGDAANFTLNHVCTSKSRQTTDVCEDTLPNLETKGHQIQICNVSKVQIS